MFLSLDGTFWVQLVNFAVFFALMNVVFLRPVGRAIAKRRAYIEGLTTDRDAFEAEARHLQAEAEARRAAARRDAEALFAKTRNEAGHESTKIAADYAAKATALVEDAHRVVEAEHESARANTERAARELADVMLERALPGGPA